MKKSKLKSFESYINFEPDGLDFDQAVAYSKVLKSLKAYCDTNGINRDSKKINDALIIKIAQKMTREGIADDSRIKLSVATKALKDLNMNSDQKTIKLVLD